VAEIENPRHIFVAKIGKAGEGSLSLI